MPRNSNRSAPPRKKAKDYTNSYDGLKDVPPGEYRSAVAWLGMQQILWKLSDDDRRMLFSCMAGIRRKNQNRKRTEKALRAFFASVERSHRMLAECEAAFKRYSSSHDPFGHRKRPKQSPLCPNFACDGQEGVNSNAQFRKHQRPALRDNSRCPHTNF